MPIHIRCSSKVLKHGRQGKLFHLQLRCTNIYYVFGSIYTCLFFSVGSILQMSYESIFSRQKQNMRVFWFTLQTLGQEAKQSLGLFAYVKGNQIHRYADTDICVSRGSNLGHSGDTKRSASTCTPPLL